MVDAVQRLHSLSEPALARAGEFVDYRGSAGHRHQKRFPGSVDFGAFSVRPVDIGSAQSQSADASPRTQCRVGRDELEYTPESWGGDRPGLTEWSADVLVVNGAV